MLLRMPIKSNISPTDSVCDWQSGKETSYWQRATHLQRSLLGLPLLAGGGLRGQGVAQALLRGLQCSCARLALRAQRLAALLLRAKLARQLRALGLGLFVAR